MHAHDKLYYKRSHTLRGTKFTMEHKQTQNSRNMENLKLTHEERRILKLNGILPQSIAKLVKSKVIRLAFKLGSRISMRESEKCYFIGITLPKSESLDLELFEELKNNANELKEIIQKSKL